jgi:hypothetical protein
MYHFDESMHHQGGPVYGNSVGVTAAGMYGAAAAAYGAPSSSGLQNPQPQYSAANHCPPTGMGQQLPGDAHKRDKDAIYR